MSLHPDENLAKDLYYYWPDGSYLLASDFCEVSDAWRGNDYGRLAVAVDATVEEVEAAVKRANQFWSTVI